MTGNVERGGEDDNERRDEKGERNRMREVEGRVTESVRMTKSKGRTEESDKE